LPQRKDEADFTAQGQARETPSIRRAAVADPKLPWNSSAICVFMTCQSAG